MKDKPKVGDKCSVLHADKLYKGWGFEEATIIKVWGFGKYDLQSKLGYVITGVEAEYLQPLPAKDPP